MQGKFVYFGQCDRLRIHSQENEAKWQEMMKNSEPIEMHDFLGVADMSAILDEGETAEEWVTESLMSDPSSKAYKSNWGDDLVLFFQSSGFEFIFKREKKNEK